jgi:hypothetical protein
VSCQGFIFPAPGVHDALRLNADVR